MYSSPGRIYACRWAQCTARFGPSYRTRSYALAQQWFKKLDNQDTGRRYRGRKLSDAGVTAKFYKAVTDAHPGHILKVDLTTETFNYLRDQRALNHARMMDGKLRLVTNNMADDDPEQIVERYLSLLTVKLGHAKRGS